MKHGNVPVYGMIMTPTSFKVRKIIINLYIKKFIKLYSFITMGSGFQAKKKASNQAELDKQTLI